jgi:serum/glucocorticoid-regulated kinase 2
MAPEILKRHSYNYSVDIYTMGAFLYELVTGLPPYYANSTEKILSNIATCDLSIPDYLSPPLRKILFILLDKEPSKRVLSF